MTETLTISTASLPPVELPSSYDVRLVSEADATVLGRLYFESYDRGDACETYEEALEDIEASFAGDYGKLLWPSSLVALDGGRVIAAVLTVEQAPWADAPPGPFIIELFTDRAHRRKGLGGHLVVSAVRAAGEVGYETAALRVEPGNVGALALYRRLGFRRWPDVEGELP